MMRLGLWVFGKTAREVMCPSYHTWYQLVASDVNFDHLVKGESARFLYCKVTIFFSLSFFYCFVLFSFSKSLWICVLLINKGILTPVTELELPKCIVAPTTCCYSGRVDETIRIFSRKALSLFRGGVGKS